MLLQTILADSFYDFLKHPTLPRAGNLHQWIQHMDPLTACVLIIAGIIFMFSGFKMHRILLAMTGAVLGAFMGAGLAERWGLVWPGAAVGLLALGITAWYLTAWAAAVLGALVGALVGAAIWNLAGLDARFAWSGAMTGAVALGLLSFIIFRASVIVFTSLLGAVMLVLGVLGIGYFYQPVRTIIDHSVAASPYILPIVVITLMGAGLTFQHMKGPASGKAAGAGASAGSAAPKAAEPKKVK
jgi:hypothetical protein